MLFFWIGTHGSTASNLNTNDLTAVTGDRRFISKENLWNNPDNWGVHVGGMSDEFSTAWNRFPVGGDIVMFQGFTGASVDGVTYDSLPRSECLYGGISSDGNWYGDPDGTGLGYSDGGTNEAGLTAQGGQVRVDVRNGYDEQLLEQMEHNGGRRARLGIMMSPDFSSSGKSPIVGDWFGLSLNCDQYSSHKTEIRYDASDWDCRTTLGGRTNIDNIHVYGGDYIEFVQCASSVGCTLGDILINRRNINWNSWWDGVGNTADATMTLSTIVFGPSSWDARTKFDITGDYVDVSEKVMSSNIIRSNSPIPNVMIYSEERSGGPIGVPLGMVKVPYYFGADIENVEIAPQKKDTATIGNAEYPTHENVIGYDETPNTCTMFNPRWWVAGATNTNNGGISLGNLTLLESYGERTGTKYNNSVMIVPQFQGTGDGYINNLEIYSGWVLPKVDYTNESSHLIINDGKIGGDSVLQTYDREQLWNGFEFSGHTSGLDNTGPGILCLDSQPNIRFKYGTRISTVQISDDADTALRSGKLSPGK